MGIFDDARKSMIERHEKEEAELPSLDEVVLFSKIAHIAGYLLRIGFLVASLFVLNWAYKDAGFWVSFILGIVLLPKQITGLIAMLAESWQIRKLAKEEGETPDRIRAIVKRELARKRLRSH